ncbi:outer membrane protein assembly factor BamB family protein [Actinoplanes nipponensis]|uniref:outer membrane protein assembly factor BamB family protein n=1 Tax=Actinoplanes nipponensis TaxID=135950 RepID=UPI0031EFB10C
MLVVVWVIQGFMGPNTKAANHLNMALCAAIPIISAIAAFLESSIAREAAERKAAEEESSSTGDYSYTAYEQLPTVDPSWKQDASRPLKRQSRRVMSGSGRRRRMWRFVLALIAMAAAMIIVVVRNNERGSTRSPTDVHIIWKAGRSEGIGAVNWSSPVAEALLTGNRLYYRIDSALRTLDVDTGKQVWRHPSDELPPNNSRGIMQESSSVVGSDITSLFAIDAHSGKLKWRRSWPHSTEPFGPVLTGGIIATTDGATVRAYQLASGRNLWARQQPDGGSDGFEDVGAGAGTIVILTKTTVAGLRASDGSLRWRVPLGAKGDPASASDIAGISSDRVIIEGTTWVQARSIHDGRVLWRYSLAENSQTLTSDKVIVIKGCPPKITCDVPAMIGLDARSGRPLWTVKLATPYPSSGWLYGGILLIWWPTGSDETVVRAIVPLSGRSVRDWTIPSTNAKAVLADKNRLYLVNSDSSVVAVSR